MQETEGSVQKNKGLKSNKFWVIIFGVVIAVSAIAMLFLSQTPASYARIYKEGTGTVTVNLTAINEPYQLVVDYTNDTLRLEGVNVLEVEHGRIRMLSSDCPDGTCIRLGWKSGGVQPIVCLPNRVVVTFDGGDRLDVDAVVW